MKRNNKDQRRKKQETEKQQEKTMKPKLVLGKYQEN